jgi:hypothetical protein
VVGGHTGGAEHPSMVPAPTALFSGRGSLWKKNTKTVRGAGAVNGTPVGRMRGCRTRNGRLVRHPSARPTSAPSPGSGTGTGSVAGEGVGGEGAGLLQGGGEVGDQARRA